MLKRVWQPFFFFLAAAGAAVWQWSFINALPPFASQFNLVLIILVFTLFFLDFRWAIFFALAAGFWLDLVSFRFFGFYLVVLCLTAFLADRLLAGWLTNRSLYSLVVLISLSAAVYSLLFFSLVFFTAADPGTFFLFRPAFWSGLVWQAGWSIAAALVMFNLAGAATRRLKPFFLAGR